MVRLNEFPPVANVMKSENKNSISKSAKATEKKISKLKTVKPTIEKIPEEIPKKKTAATPKTAGKSFSDKVESAAKKISGMAKKVQEFTEKFTPKAREIADKAEPVVKKVRAKIKEKLPAIPPILLEDDAPSAPSAGGPGQRYSLGPTSRTERASVTEASELPEAYGTKKLLLTARDPHWLYVHWDLTDAQMKKYNSESRDGHLVLRVYKNKLGENLQSETHVHPESRHWFVHVGQGGCKFVAELGYYKAPGGWTKISSSGATLTPSDAMSEDTSVRFATIPVDMPFEDLIALVKIAIRENVPLAEAILQLRAEGFKNLPSEQNLRAEKWTPQQETALAKIITMDSVRRVWIGSLEITELLRRHLVSDASSIAAAQFSLPTSLASALSSLSSPFGGMQRSKSFWFNVNAELIIYGATEPDAKVTIGERRIKLRPDGTFSYRFILPDGDFDLPAEATSADGDDARQAKLKFSRKTNYSGEVGAHPQDPKMKKPLVESVA